jgi:hypothetical protein
MPVTRLAIFPLVKTTVRARSPGLCTLNAPTRAAGLDTVYRTRLPPPADEPFPSRTHTANEQIVQDESTTTR